MRFLSICSGIEAASVAFHPLGWQALAVAEIEPFPCSLLAHHYPQVPNLGDLSGTQCASAEDVSPVLQAQNPTAVAYEAESEGQRAESEEPVAFSARERGDDGRGYARPPQVFDGAVGALDTMKPHCVALSEVAQPLRSNPHNNSDPGMEATMHVLSQPRTENREPGTVWRVRRLTPEECEMLQGFPIGYTLIPGTSSKKRKGEDLRDTMDYLISLGVSPAQAEVLAHSPDGPRYKALGNSWAVPVARWIARRIDACAKALSRQ